MKWKMELCWCSSVRYFIPARVPFCLSELMNEKKNQQKLKGEEINEINKNKWINKQRYDDVTWRKQTNNKIHNWETINGLLCQPISRIIIHHLDFPSERHRAPIARLQTRVQRAKHPAPGLYWADGIFSGKPIHL